MIGLVAVAVLGGSVGGSCVPVGRSPLAACPLVFVPFRVCNLPLDVGASLFAAQLRSPLL